MRISASPTPNPATTMEIELRAARRRIDLHVIAESSAKEVTVIRCDHKPRDATSSKFTIEPHGQGPPLSRARWRQWSRPQPF